MITIQEYEQAKVIIAEYKKQNAKKIKKVFTLDDLQILIGSIGIPYLSLSIVNEKFAGDLSEKIEDMGFLVDYVSLDDLGYIVVNFGRVLIKDAHIDAVLNALNSK